MKSIEVKGTARTIAERSSEQARALKEIRKNGGVPCVLYGGNEVVHFTVPNESFDSFGQCRFRARGGRDRVLFQHRRTYGGDGARLSVRDRRRTD